ncbi:MAG: hypothetical protein L0Z62_41470 [Gemmataceae bacterium]|nr:hypothetical protein [Gemmataceae bacterium]
MPHVDTPQSLCRFGLARCDITPPVGIYHRMWGAATHDRATGVHRPLTATALAFRSHDGSVGPEAEQVVVALDLCLLWEQELSALRHTVCRRTSLTPEQLVVVFAHTHGAGLMGLERVGLPGGELIPAYLEELGRRVAEAVATALHLLEPATITYGTGRCGLAAHRDFWDEGSRQFVCGFNPGGPGDDTVLVARVTGEMGEVLATVVNYACHPTTLAWQNTLISPDFPGAMREVVEEATGAPCVFLQGASGDLGPREGFVGDPAVADRNGRQLGYATLAALEALPPPGTRFRYAGPVVSGATLGTWEHVALDDSSLERQARWRCRRWTVALPYRADLGSLADTEQARQHWQAQEEAAHRAGDVAQARDCRALAERMTRKLTRLGSLPPGESFPLPVVLWQMGDALWLAVEGEHYQQFQCALRQRCVSAPLMVLTLANGSRPAYLPTRDTYSQGIYQESIAVLAPGCLETLTEDIAGQLQSWLSD